jgi:ABC-2 type transport system permease protein
MSTEGNNISQLKKLWQRYRFVPTSWKLNLAGAMEFRMSFFMTAGMMFLNNTVWIFFWGLFFNRFNVVNGWQMDDVMMMWAVTTVGYGLAAVLFGNVFMISNLIATGQLDTFLAQPKPVLLNVLVSRMSLVAIGDLMFGLVLYPIFGDVSFIGFLKFVAACLAAMIIFIFTNLIVQSLAFFIGNAQGLAQQFNMIVITFSSYPTGIFKGAARMMLFTIIPAGFISYMPIGLLRETQPSFLIGLAIALPLLVLIGLSVFYYGLRRYGSGNMMTMRM